MRIPWVRDREETVKYRDKRYDQQHGGKNELVIYVG
jgi:hypothetical protein